MNKFFKRLALLLAVLMIVSMMPVQLFADNSVAGEGQSNGTGENGTGEASGNSNAVAKIGDTGYESLADAIANATPDANGVITYEISGKAEISGADQWISFVKNAEGVTAVKFVGMTADAEISITSSGSILGVQGVDVDVSFENLTLSHPNGAWVDDLGHATKYFTCMVRNSGHTVTYTNCTFPNGLCNSQYGNTVVDGCTFSNTTTGMYNFWNYGGNTEIKDSTFTGVRGIKTYNEGTLAVAPTVKIENTTFDGLTEKAAIVTSKATDITLDNVSATKCTKGFFQKAIEGSSKEQEIVVVPVGSNISGKFNVNGTIGVASAEEFNISGGTFTSEVSSDYLADGFELKKNIDGTYGVTAGKYVAQIGDVKYETLAAALAAAKRKSTVTLLADTCENVTISTPYVTLDLNGFTLNGSTGERKPALTITARVTVMDSSAAQTGTIMREDTAENSGVSSHYVIDIQGSGWLTFESGTVKNNSGSAAGKGASLVRVGNDSVAKYPGLNIKGGTFTQDNFIVIKVDSGDLFLNGGTLNSANSYAIENWHRATIKGGTVNGTAAAWTYSGGLNSTLEISGGTVNGDVESISYDGTAGKKASVSITGGVVNGTLMTGIYGSATEPSKEMATIEVTGGTFTKDPTKYVIEDSAITKNADGTFGVAKAYLAKVGENSYYTMDEAFKAQTASGEPIVLLRDYTTGSPFNSGTVARTVDLNGHTWTCTGKDANSAAFEINNANASLTVKNGKIVSSQLVGLIPSASGGVSGGTITYDNSSLVFEGVEMSTTATSGIETNGNNTNDTVTLKNSTLNVPNGFGIYFPSSGTLTVENSKITAKTMGVQVCSGVLRISGADTAITVTGDAVPKAENDGAIQDGAAISIVNRTGYKGLGTVTVSGGKFTAKEGNSAIKAYDWANKTESNFTASEKVAFSGGTFSSEVKEDLCADGFIPTKNADGTYGVKAGKYVAQIGDVKYETLAEAIAAANAGDTVTLLAEVTADVVIDKNITLDLGGKTLTNTGAGKATISVTGGTVTVKNGTVIGGTSYYNIEVTKGSNANLTLEDITATAGNTGSSMIDNWGTMTIKSGTYTGGLNVVKSEEGSTLTINGGKFTLEYATSGYTGVIFAYGTTTITGGEFIQNLTTTGRWNHPQVVATGVVEGYTAITRITGGTFTNKKSGEGIFRGLGKATSDNFEVSGGTFNKSIPESYCAEGFIPTKNADGTYGVKEGKYVAQIGSTKYETLADAIRLAANGKTITLLDNIDISTTGLTISTERTITLDLNGHTLKVANTDAGNIKVYGKLTLKDSTDTAKNGTGTGKIYTETPYIYGTQDKVMIATMSGGEFTMESGLIDAASFTTDNANVGHFAVSVQNDNGNATVTINGGHIKAGWYAIAGNGQNSSFEGNIIVNGGILESVADYAIYHPHAGTTTINGGVVFGAAGGVSINRGKLVVNGGTITSKGTGTTGNWGDGTGNQAAAAINVNAKYETTTVEIKGGTITAEKDAILLTNGRDGSIAVSGGTFSSAVPEEYCADRYIPTQNADGTYGVKEGMYVAQIGDVKYETLKDAFAAAKDGDTITIVRNFTTDETKTTAADRATVTANVTLDFGSYVMTVPASLEPTDNFMAILVDGSTLTVEGTTGGIVSGDAETCGVYGFNVKGGGKLVINGGSYYCGITVAQAQLGTIEVNGGSFAVNDGSGKYPGYMFNCVDANYVAGTAGITVNGGTFVGYDPRNNTAEGTGTSFVAEGVGINKDENGTFTAKSGMAAQIVDENGGSVKAYAGHYDAIAAAKDGEKVILLSDRKNFVTNTINANITIDLNGKTLSVGNNNPFFRTNGEVTIQNGTISSDYRCVIVNAYNKLTLKNVKITSKTDNGWNLVNVCSNAEVTIDKDTVLTATSGTGAAVFVGQEADAKYTLNVYGKVIQEAKSFAISGNGSYKGTTTINIYDGAEVKSASVAIYQPQAGAINVYGGLVEGYCAIGIKSGSLNIKGGTVRGTANDNLLDDSNSVNGTISYDGSAIVVDSRSTGYAGNVKINVTGGTVESYYSTAIREIGEQGKTDMTQLTKLNVIGGSVLGASKNPVNVTSDMLVCDISVINISVSGGTFKHAIPEEYCADGFIPTQNYDGTYGVKEGKYVAQIGDVKYETLEEAFAAAKNGDTITLLEDCKSDRINLEDKSVTVVLNGKTLTSTAAYGVMFCAKNGNKITIDGTVEGSKLVGTLMITAKTDGHIEVNGGTYESNQYCPIYVNGAVSSENSTVTVKNAIIKATNISSDQDMGCGVYLAGYSTSVFENCTITAPITGIEIRAGKLTLNNCDVTGGNGEVTADANGNGTTVTNAALAISQHTTKKPIDVTIDGGTFNGTAAVYQTDVQGTGSADVKIAVKSGTFNGTISGETDGTIAISGGKFKVKVDDKYFDGDHACSTDMTDGYYTVEGHPITKVGLTLGEDISIRIVVDAKYKDGKIKVTYETYDPNTKGMVTKELIINKCEYAGLDEEGNKKYQFRISNVTPQMADVVFTLQYLDSEGNKIGSAKQISIVEYCRKFAETNKFEAYKAKIGQLLNYCATAMDFRAVSHKDDMYNGLSWAKRATALRAKISEFGYTVADIDFGKVGQYSNAAIENIVTGFGIEFAESIKLYYFIALDNYKDGYTYVADGLLTPVPVYENGVLIGYRVYLTVAMDGYHAKRTLKVYDANGEEVQRIGMAPDYALKYLYNSDKQTNEFKQLCKAAYQYFIAFAE